MHHVMKRKRHKEEFDKLKVSLSIKRTALNCHYTQEQADKLAATVTKEVMTWIKDKSIVESKEIRRVIYEHIPDAEVARMYKEHFSIC